MPKFGDTCGEKCVTVLSIILFVIGIIELYGTSLYAVSFTNATSEACCGLIAENSKSEYDDVFACKESDIEDSHIPSTNINGAILCEIDGVPCDTYTVSGITTSFEDCLINGGYSLSDMCGSSTINSEAKDASTASINLCWLSIGLIVITSIYCCLDFFECTTEECETKKFQKWCLMLQALTFILLLILFGGFVEQAASDGYDARWSGSDAGDYFEDNCIDIETIWVDFEIESYPFVESAGYTVITVFGMLFTICDLLILCCKVQCSDKS